MHMASAKPNKRANWKMNGFNNKSKVGLCSINMRKLLKRTPSWNRTPVPCRLYQAKHKSWAVTCIWHCIWCCIPRQSKDPGWCGLSLVPYKGTKESNYIWLWPHHRIPGSSVTEKNPKPLSATPIVIFLWKLMSTFSEGCRIIKEKQWNNES